MIARSLLALSSLYEFINRSFDFVIEFSQYDLDVDIFVDLTLGMGVYINIVEWVLNLNKPIYGLKKANENWFDLLNFFLERRGYHQSQVDPCIFYRKKSVVLNYVDDFLIVSHKQETISTFIESLNNGPEKHVLTDKGEKISYLGVNIKKNKMGNYGYHNHTWQRKVSTMLYLQCPRVSKQERRPL